jgi:pyridoxal phosphate enzyme (YggS family)
MTTVGENIELVRRRIEAAAARAGRDAGGVKLIGVTKGVAADAVEEAIAAGLTDFGENFVQEASARIKAIGPLAQAATWHFIGHLQRNKVGAAVELFSVIHSVDSVRLAEQLSRRAVTPVRILLEVNVVAETSKFGFRPAEVGDAVSRIGRISNIDLAGLMTVAPAGRGAEAVRPVFRELREQASANGLRELSMGMSDDFEVAVEEGATMVRIGRAIFGERPA